MTMIAYLAALALALSMFATGLGMRGRDFERVASLPGATVLGLGLQSLLMPIFAALLAKAFIPASTEGFGLVLVALAPATAASHVFVGLAGGNVGLARTLTLCSSVMVLVVLSALSLGEVLYGFWPVMVLAYLLPLLLGLGVQALGRSFAVRQERRMTNYASVLTGLTALATLWEWLEWQHTLVFILSLIVAMCSGLFGWGAGRMLGVGKGEAIGLSLPMQNIALPLALAWVTQGQQMAIAPALYGVAMYLSAFVLIALWRRFRR